ncbi:MAG: 30S ribosomal protein S8 [Ardenticatenia bacterium]|uniref:Small ribosomal subunit protein uS8 n=1 Tax=Ardenticatena maritima TaxID=872965 RepID=A0A0M9UBM3_9CHLR|nr:30S ribosomal protein S8 [Ardenticatena maritima]KPL90040.1 30S ribosomal protein S8 [Ardenticatena maritima]RME10465.1 MAG: 30S ribosomal protein S8 [Ardenticatenia bacterium]GAP61897.1 small subunit ribosomal protein S8 [Ardenticatena maritima]
MTVTDPIADMLTRIRNAQMARHRYVDVPTSKMKHAIAQILADEGYIERVEVIEAKPRNLLRLWLKYDENKKPAITNLKRVSKPGRRIYAGKREIPWVLSGIGIAILSTSRGIMTDRQARRLGVGGEVLCYVW